MKELKDNSNLYKIDPSITQIRKEYEDDWIRTFHTQYPYGCNDRIDSLKNKSMFNCTFDKGHGIGIGIVVVVLM